MKIIDKHSTVYSSPTIDVMTVAAEGLLCTSSGELDNLQKEDFNFNWGN